MKLSVTNLFLVDARLELSSSRWVARGGCAEGDPPALFHSQMRGHELVVAVRESARDRETRDACDAWLLVLLCASTVPPRVQPLEPMLQLRTRRSGGRAEKILMWPPERTVVLAWQPRARSAPLYTRTLRGRHRSMFVVLSECYQPTNRRSAADALRPAVAIAEKAVPRSTVRDSAQRWVRTSLSLPTA
jgi:hypothetical protein